MAKAIMVQGTASNAGKSVLAAALCRIFHQDGYRAAPFKSQNMALNSFVTADGLEMGRAQVMQAEAAGIVPDVRMNPVLLKPTSEMGSQVIVCGEVVGEMQAQHYYAYRRQVIPRIRQAYDSLAAEHDILVLEGAGSPAEINLKKEDIVNMGLAKLAQAPVLLVGDIDRGGVFASLAGTLLLLEPEERALVKGLIINKFRGDLELLRPGLEEIERITGVPVLGVIPYEPLDLDDEDSLSERLSSIGRGLVDIAVIRLPHISNFTDFSPFSRIPQVGLRYAASVGELGEPDLVILPGTKNTISDLRWLKAKGFGAALHGLAGMGKPIFGICGGYQMLGTKVSDPDGVEAGGEERGLSLLSCETVLSAEKRRAQVRGRFDQVGGIFSGLTGVEFSGYEIHMGRTQGEVPLLQLDGAEDGGQKGNLYGSYVHGLFDSPAVSQQIVHALLKKKGLDLPNVERIDLETHKQQQYDRLAQLVRTSLDLEKIYQILEQGVSV